MTLVGEALFEHVNYEQTTTVYTGQNSTTTLKSTVTEDTKALFEDFPVILRCRPFTGRGRASFFGEAGFNSAEGHEGRHRDLETKRRRLHGV